MPLSNDPEKQRQWQQRSKERALAKMREKGRKLAPPPVAVRVAAAEVLKGRKPAKTQKRKPPPNDGPWRTWCIAARGEQCRSCGDTNHVEMDHIIPKSQDSTARADVENGLPLCGAFSRNTPGGCHPKKTAGTLKFDPSWLDPDQIEYLAAKGWVAWDADGQPYGRGMKHFLPKSGGSMKGGHHGNSN